MKIWGIAGALTLGILSAGCGGPADEVTIRIVDVGDFDPTGFDVYLTEGSVDGNETEAWTVWPDGTENRAGNCTRSEQLHPEATCELRPTVTFNGGPVLIDSPDSEGMIRLESAAVQRKVRLVWPEMIEDCEHGANLTLEPGPGAHEAELTLLTCA